MKKILFIIPAISTVDKISTAPYGVLSLISYINKLNEYDIKVIDFNTNDYNIESIITSFEPNYVCISALFDTNFSFLKQLIPLLRLYYKGIILIGGGLATSIYKILLEEISGIDAICFGEGEIPLKKLLESKDIHDISDVSSAWITKKSIENNIIPKYEFIENLDDIPLINFDYVKISNYNNRSPALIDKQNKIEMNIHTSRGCPFNCVFCSNSNIHGKRVRYMSIDKVKETIKYYIDKYSMNVLLIEDDNFLFKKDRALEILKIIKEFGIRVDFPNGLAVSGIDDDISKALYEAGVEVVPLAIESCSDYILKEIMQKPLRKEQIVSAVKSLKKFSIRIHAFIIIGIPGEFDEHRKETYNMLLDLDIDWVYIFIAIPISGSRLYKICQDNNYLINNDFDKHNISNCVIKAPGVDPDKIKEEAFYMNMVINYICNSNYRNENYDKCLSYFSNVAKRYPNNAVVHYMLYKTIIKKDKFWNRLFKKLEDDDYI